jgi:hypothetical protein
MQSKMRTVKKVLESLNANIFFHIHFKNKAKELTSIFSIISNPSKFQQNFSKNGARHYGLILVRHSY